MFKTSALFKKTFLALIVLAIGLAALPGRGVSAAGLKEPAITHPDNSRLEKVWAREQNIFQREGNRLSNAGAFFAKVQSLINKANTKGWDTSAVQAALNALTAVIPDVQAAHDPGTAIIAAHAGFDASGKVNDRTSAIATVKSLAQVLKNTRTAMNGTGKALHDAIKAFRAAHPHPETKPAK